MVKNYMAVYRTCTSLLYDLKSALFQEYISWMKRVSKLQFHTSDQNKFLQVELYDSTCEELGLPGSWMVSC